MSEEQPYYPQAPDAAYGFVESLGFGFMTGLTGSSVISLFGGLRRGGGGLAGAARAVSVSAPRAAGTLAAYFGLFSALETTMDLARPNKEDLWNSLAAGAVSWAAVGVRRGAAGAALVAVGLASEFFDGRIPAAPGEAAASTTPAPVSACAHDARGHRILGDPAGATHCGSGGDQAPGADFLI